MVYKGYGKRFINLLIELKIMIFISHLSYPALLFMLIAKIFSISYSFSDLIVLIFFAILPDLDFLFHKYVMKRGFDSWFRHHEWFTHWPSTYLPIFIIWAIFPNMKTALASLGILSHFILDTFLNGGGLMWFAPFSKKYYNLFGKKTKGHYGWGWFQIYRKLAIFKIDVIACTTLVVLLLFNLL